MNPTTIAAWLSVFGNLLWIVVGILLIRSLIRSHRSDKAFMQRMKRDSEVMKEELRRMRGFEPPPPNPQ